MRDIDYSIQVVREVEEVLEWLKWEHSRDEAECSIYSGYECDCGADEVNVMIDSAIYKLKTILD